MYVDFIYLLIQKEYNVNDILNIKCSEFAEQLSEYKECETGYEKSVTTENYDKFCEENKKKQ